jgi:drug/metabolite transporter (DMT)-like permease
MLFGIWLFHEHLSALQLFGSVLIFVSVSLVVKNFSNFKLDKGALLGLVTGLLFGLAVTSWSYVGRHTDTLSWAAVSFAGASLASLLFSPQAIHKMQPMLSRAVLPKMALLGVFYAIGSIAMLYAYKIGPLSLVSPVRQTGIVVTTVLALALLRSERVRVRRKVLASAVCMVGVLLLVM